MRGDTDASYKFVLMPVSSRQRSQEPTLDKSPRSHDRGGRYRVGYLREASIFASIGNSKPSRYWISPVWSSPLH